MVLRNGDTAGMKRTLIVLGIGWGLAAVLFALGGRTIWFGLTPGTGIADVVAASAGGLALMIGGLGIGLAANGLSSAIHQAGAE